MILTAWPNSRPVAARRYAELRSSVTAGKLDVGVAVELEVGQTKMPCVLHFEMSESLDALEGIAMVPYRVEARGSPNPRRLGQTFETTSLSFDVSDAGFEQLAAQFEDACSFLSLNEKDLQYLAHRGQLVLDFGYTHRRIANAAMLVQCDRLPKELVKLAARLDVEIEISLYPEDDAEP